MDLIPLSYCLTVKGCDVVKADASPSLVRLLNRSTVLQSKRANFVGLKIFCYFQESVQEGSTLSLWEDTTSTCTALLEVTCYHVI